MKIEGIGFREALEILADRAGIKLPEYEKKNGEKKQKQQSRCSCHVFLLLDEFHFFRQF